MTKEELLDQHIHFVKLGKFSTVLIDIVNDKQLKQMFQRYNYEIKDNVIEFNIKEETK